MPLQSFENRGHMNLEDYKKAFQQGDNEPLGFIFQEYGSYCVRNLQKKLSCSVDDAKDIFIEAVMNFRQRVLNGKIQELTNLRGYLFTTCVNMQMASNRKTQRHMNHQDRIKHYFYDVFDGDPAIELEEGSKESLLKLCIQTMNILGEKCKSLLKAFYIEELTLDEIVEQLDFSTKDVAKTSKSRCMQKWRKEIAQEMKKMTA